MLTHKESLLPEKETKKKKIPCVIVFILLIPFITFGFSILLYFTGVTSKVLISEYNECASIWNENVEKQFSELGFFNMTINDEDDYNLELEQPEYNKFYPTQDSCLIDFTCDTVLPAFYQVNLPESELLEVFNYTLSYQDSVIIEEESLNLTSTLELSFEEIGCVLTSDCLKECNNRHGVYNSEKSTCTIPIYLERICYRIRQNEDNQWILDFPNAYPLKGLLYNATGCEYESEWNSHIYSTTKQNHLIIQLRYYMDPYIISSSLTQGCSTVFFQDTEKINCFGHSDEYLFSICLIIGSISLILMIIIITVTILCILKSKKQKITNGENS